MAGNIAQLLLMAISFSVCIGLCRKKNMWGWIMAYWLVLSIKNLMDLVGMA